jgi:hypothetical protein
MPTPVLWLLVMATAISVVFNPDGCELDQAQIAFIPPNSARVLLTTQCSGGGITCWHRWIEVEGQRRAESRMCEKDGDGRPLQAPTGGP